MEAAGSDSRIDQLVSLVDSANPYAGSFEEIRPVQLEAINERFQDQLGKIKLLQNRAEVGGITEIRSMSDVVPLLFAHTAYKSYPENWLFEGKWDRLGKWLDTVSTGDVSGIDTSAVQGFDQWLELLEQHGHYVACSSGTTGKCAMMDGTLGDIQFAGRSLLNAIIWSGLAPNNDRRMIGLGQVASTAKNRETGKPMAMAFSAPGRPPFMPDVPPMTMGGITEMVVLRKKIADGTAKPSEVAYFEGQAVRRQKDMESATEQAVEALIRYRNEPLHITGMYGALFKVCEMVRERGYSAKDFEPNTFFISGGLKGAQLPADYQDYIFGTLNLAPERTCHAYGMQELNTTAPRCTAGRYHVAPWVMLLLLDEAGETLIEPTASGEVEGRAGFFDLSVEGRWGGVISGDKIKASWEPCACGNQSPTISPDIQRYADLSGGDKITCAGTIDAYVRGAV